MIHLLLNRHSSNLFLYSGGLLWGSSVPSPLQSRWMLVYSRLINGLSRLSSVIGHMTYMLSYWGHKCKSLNCNWDACLHPFPESHDGSLSLWGLTSGFHRQWPQRTIVTHPQLVGSVTCRGRGGSSWKQGQLSTSNCHHKGHRSHLPYLSPFLRIKIIHCGVSTWCDSFMMPPQHFFWIHIHIFFFLA